MIKGIFLDIDGTLTDGGIYYTDSGEEIKRFNVQDGLLISKANRYGIRFFIITGRKSPVVLRRAAELGITEIYQDIKDKKKRMLDLCTKYDIRPEETAYIGDDLNDIAPMSLCGTAMCPDNACEEVKQRCEFVSQRKGGDGAVRDCLEYIFKKNDIYHDIISEYLC
ncbi:MAG: KdsC family phosphatase [Candidatus Muiribacteriaceae bacterium]